MLMLLLYRSALQGRLQKSKDEMPQVDIGVEGNIEEFYDDVDDHDNNDDHYEEINTRIDHKQYIQMNMMALD